MAINLRKEGDIKCKDDYLPMDHSLPAGVERITPNNNFNPMITNSEFYKKLERIVFNGKDKQLLEEELDNLELKLITKERLKKNMSKQDTTKLPDVNDVIKKINTLTTDIGSNGHVTNAKYLSVLSVISNMIVDVKESIEKRDRELLKRVHTLSGSQTKVELLELLDK